MKVEKRLRLLSALGVGIMAIVLVVQSPELIGTRSETDATVTLQEQKAKIKLNELPDPVKKTLRNETSQGWKVVNAFVITSDEAEKNYEVELRKNQQAQLVRFDRNGNIK